MNRIQERRILAKAEATVAVQVALDAVPEFDKMVQTILDTIATELNGTAFPHIARMEAYHQIVARFAPIIGE